MTLDSMWCVYFKSFPNFVQVAPHGLALLVQVPGGGAEGLVAAGHRLVPGGLLLQLRLNRITYMGHSVYFNTAVTKQDILKILRVSSPKRLKTISYYHGNMK